MIATLPAKAGVYLIECNRTEKVYVGSGIDIAQRERCHLWKLKKNRHPNPKLQNAWNKYGAAAFVFYPLELCADIRTVEAYWIRALDAVKRGFNLVYDTESAMQGRKVGVLTRLQRSMSCLAAVPKGRAHYRFGKKETKAQRATRMPAFLAAVKSPGYREKMRARNTGTRNPFFGRKHTEASLKKMRGKRK